MTRSEYVREMRVRVAHNVRFYRHKRGLKQTELADLVGVAENTIYLMERTEDAKQISFPMICVVAHALGVPMEALLVEREPQPSYIGRIGQNYLRQQREHNHDIRNQI